MTGGWRWRVPGVILAAVLAAGQARAAALSPDQIPYPRPVAPSVFDMRVLAAHNAERVAQGLPALRWNTRIAAGARHWARYLTRLGMLVHSGDGDGRFPRGENLWVGTTGYYSPEAMVGLWISEKADFRPGLYPDNSKTGDPEDIGHYTQLMWRRTKEVGCAIVPGARDEVLVCRYAPAGNIVGEKPF